MSEIAATLPWLVPGIAVTLVLSVPASGPVGRWLRVRRGIAWVGLFSLGVIVSSTLSPLRPDVVVPSDLDRTCDFARTWLAPLGDLASDWDATLNILLFLPLGWAIGLAPWSVRKIIVMSGAIGLPFAIEAIQLLAPPLGRGCESADVVDNPTGLVIGLGAGITSAVVSSVVRRSEAHRD